MNHGSLFSGIGGFDLAAEWKGWTNVFHCEKDEKARSVLHKNFPHVNSHEDIFELDGAQYEGQIDILTGGFPCQPFSLAGKRRGTDDDRHLWPQMLRVIREIKPTYVIGENVFGLTNMEDGRTFDNIWTSLEDEGYTVESFILPAAAVQAWHRRDRVWIIAYANDRNERRTPRRFQRKNGQRELQKQQQLVQPCSSGEAWFYTHPKGSNVQRECNERPREAEYRGLGSEKNPAYPDNKRLEGEWQCRANQRWQSAEGYFGQSGRTWTDWTTEPRVGRVANGIPNRVDRLKQLGNAIVPQVAYEIFNFIEQVMIKKGGEK